MCGIAVILGGNSDRQRIQAMVARQRHRGPDADGIYRDPHGRASLGHARLSIIDPSVAGRQPMSSADGRLWIVFNGEIYNHVELRAELGDYPFRSRTDTEVVLAAYDRWGEACLDRFVGMFAFAIWDESDGRLFAARDRFGVKPLYAAQAPDGVFLLASEIKALHAAGVPRDPDSVAWATYLEKGLQDHGERTFWQGVRAVPAGSACTWRPGAGLNVRRWYDLAARVGPDLDERPDSVVREEFLSLLLETIRLRFRADVPVGINVSGGVDSSLLLALVARTQPDSGAVQAFTFTTGHPVYDELPWVERAIASTGHRLQVCELRPEDVPGLCDDVAAYADEPIGGLPTLAYARLFERARQAGVIVLLDGQGIDEAWAGYDYYLRVGEGEVPTIQGTREPATRSGCLTPEFRALAEPWRAPTPFGDALRDAQLRDLVYVKIPRALRFNDRVSMRASTELREPFLDHRLVELALRQPRRRKIRDGVGKYLVREVAAGLVPSGLVTAPKRPVQTPQREWLRGPLRGWAEEQIETAIRTWPDWLDAEAVRREWRAYQDGASDNSFYVWQWISLAAVPRRDA